jgi:hypothetical protein
MASSSEPVVATSRNVTLVAADTEYSVELPLGCKYFSLQCRTAVDARFAFESGRVATPTPPYITLKSGQSYSPPEKFSGRPTVYLGTASAAAPVMELLAWATPPRAQIDTVTIALTWATADTIVLTIGSQSVTVTIGGDTTTQEVALTLKQAFNGETITDGTATVDPAAGAVSLSNFADLVATVSESVVTITGAKGVAFSLSVVETTAGDGTATEATVTAIS